MSKNKGLDRNNTTTVPYGPATGVEDPGRQPVVDDTPYAGDHGPGGVHTPGYVPDGPATGREHVDEPRQPVADDTPYEGEYGPGGVHEPGHAAGGPGHAGCEHK